ncbi:ABC transporter ATP-binding protein [Lachnospiraceae bacterium 56-18]|jgi:ABC-2 type transport system ATP-binding protein
MELKMSNLTKEFRDMTAVKNVSYTMTTGVYGLLGVNGAGKTTLMRMLCTLLKPTGGSITWDGEDIFEMDGKYRKILGYLPQDFGYYPDFTVYDYLMYIASIKGVRPAAARQRIKLLLDQVGMKKAAKRKMKKLSGGMKRRIGIAQAMLGDPKILILDEPTAGLDPNERIRFRNLISELAGERLVLLSTHIVSDIEYIANEILLMQGGEIKASGTAEELLSAMPEEVWSLEVEKKEIERYMRNYKVSNVKTIPGGAVLRLIASEKPSSRAVREEATLEDLFLDYFGERAGENDDEI